MSGAQRQGRPAAPCRVERPVARRIAGALLLGISLLSCSPPAGDAGAAGGASDALFREQVRQDFLHHREDVVTIGQINSGIVNTIDSLLAGQRTDTMNADLIRGIMNTRSYDLTILAYREILNGTYLSDPVLKLRIARHVAMFAGIAEAKRGWAEQWDKTARPYLYQYGLLSPRGGSNAIADPVFRSVLFDRRMFAHDVELYTPRLLASADSVLALLGAARN